MNSRFFTELTSFEYANDFSALRAQQFLASMPRSHFGGLALKKSRRNWRRSYKVGVQPPQTVFKPVQALPIKFEERGFIPRAVFDRETLSTADLQGSSDAPLGQPPLQPPVLQRGAGIHRDPQRILYAGEYNRDPAFEDDHLQIDDELMADIIAFIESINARNTELDHDDDDMTDWLQSGQPDVQPDDKYHLFHRINKACKPYVDRMSKQERVNYFSFTTAFFVPGERSLLGKYTELSNCTDAIVNCVECAVLFYYAMFRARTTGDRIAAVMTYSKMMNIAIPSDMIAMVAIFGVRDWINGKPIIRDPVESDDVVSRFCGVVPFEFWFDEEGKQLDQRAAIKRFLSVDRSKWCTEMVPRECYIDDNGSMTLSHQEAMEKYLQRMPGSKSYPEMISELEVQSGLEETFDTLQSFLDKFELIKVSPFFSKLYKFGMFGITMSLFKPFGITLDSAKFEPVAQEALKLKYHMGPDFIHCFLDTTLFIVRRGYQCYQEGSIMPMFHSEAKYQKWYDEATKIIRQSQFLSNPEVHGIDRFAFMADLKNAIEKGQCMRKCMIAKEDKLIVTRLLASLELTHDMEVTKRAAQKDRRMPLCVLLYGGSGIGKSTVENIIFQHYGKLRGLNTSSEFRYVRNPTEEFWSGMNSTQWCIVMDDIGFLSPTLGVMDPSLAELLCVANNVPFVPAQAELSDKGRTPVKAELVIGSTNTVDLNLVAYFSCPLAVQRRFPYVLDLRVKPKYEDPKRPGMLDPTKLPPQVEGKYPNWWNITIFSVKPNGENRRQQRADLVEGETFTDITDFLMWFNVVVSKHNSTQDLVMSGNSALENTKLCGKCFMPSLMCRCSPWDEILVESCSEEEKEDLQAGEVEPMIEQIANRDPEPSYITIETFAQRKSFVEYVTSWDLFTRLVCWWYMVLYWFSKRPWIGVILALMWGEGWFVQMVFASKHRARLCKVILGHAGTRVQESWGNVKSLAALVLGVAAAGAVLKSAHSLWTMSRALEVQGVVASRETKPTSARVPAPEESERPVVSYANPVPMSTLDLSQTTMSQKNSDIRNLEKNVYRAVVYFETQQGERRWATTALNVRGSVYMCNIHGMPPPGDFFVSIVSSAHDRMGTTIRKVLVTESMVVRVLEHDLMFILLRNRPPATNLTEYFPATDYVGWVDGTYYGRDREGVSWTRKVTNLKPQESSWLVQDHKVTRKTWRGTVDVSTDKGDCGSPLLALTPSGPVILGTHILGRGSAVEVLSIARDFVKSNCDKLEPHVVSRGKVEISTPTCQRTMTDLSVQSVIHTTVPGVGHVYGSFAGEFRQRGRTSVARTFIHDAALRHGYRCERTQPNMTKEPWRLALADLNRPVTLMRHDTLVVAQKMFLHECHVENLSRVHVFPLHIAINGAPGVLYCDAMNRTSSAGAPYKKSKKYFMYYIDESVSTDMWISQEIEDTVYAMIATYQRGERVHAVYVGHLKDECVTFEKAAKGATRVFTASGMAYTLVVRMYLLSIIMHMQKNRYVFETGPGTVVQSLEWEEMRVYLTAFGEDRIVAGDYAKFDKRMPANVILATFDIMLDICERAGYTEADLKVVRGIGYDTAFPTVDFNGDLIEFFGSNPSGHPLTVIVNGLANSLYMRYCFLILRPIGNTRSFKECVNLMTYGDDNIMGVSQEAPWFNHTAIQLVLANVDIGYTMADKTAESVPYIHIQEANFLKRTWRFDTDLGVHAAQLDHASIDKMLTMCTASKNITPQAQAIAVIGTAVREYFWYGRAIFEERKQILLDIVCDSDLELYVEASTFPTWEELAALFWDNSRHVKRELATKLEKNGGAVAHGGGSSQPQSPLGAGTISVPVESCLANNSLLNVAQKNNTEESSCRTETKGRALLERALAVRAIELTTTDLQADVAVTEVGDPVHMVRETVAFHDEAEGMYSGINRGPDGISAMDQTENIDFVKFLSRPVRIANFTWNETDAVGTTHTYDPWNLYFTDTRVRYKLNNFAFIQCKLKVKILVNASPFYYGAMYMGYQPLPALTPSTIVADAGTRYLIPYSQRPHLWIYPQGSEGGEMTLPYFNNQNWISAQSSQAMTNMGQLKFINYTALQSANGVTGAGVTIAVYAWAEDVKISGPSAGLATQSLELQGDEYGTGVVSAPASAISNFASWFEDIPVIGRFATATRIGASAVSTIASLFGFTNVPVIADSQPYRPEAFPKMASTEIGFPVEKLTLDPKNELSVDPSILGLDSTDEMVTNHLMQRESYLCTTSWTNAQAIDTILFSSNVNPMMFDNDGATNSKLYMTPPAWVSALFENWRGDMIFRFRIVASPFHKGRLRISYDPAGYAGESIINDANTSNVVFTSIVDLGDKNDVEFRIPYQQALAFLLNRNNYASTGIQWSTSAAPTFAYDALRDNGTITVRVQTLLTAPIATTSVSILVFVRAAENIEVANPRTVPNLSTFAVQSGEVFAESDDVRHEVMGTDTRDPHADRYLVNFGESVKSLRQLMRRTSLIGVTTYANNTTNDYILMSKRFTKIPPDYGYDPNGLHSAKGLVVTASNFPFNYVFKTPMNWILPAFVAYRGSTIWTFNVDGVQPYGHVRVYRSNQSGADASESVATFTKGTVSANASFFLQNSDSGAAGQALTNQNTNAGISVLCPNYGKYRFQSTSLIAANHPSATIDDAQFDEFLLEVAADGVTGTTPNGLRVWSYSSIGTDFGMHFFLNVPTLWMYSAVPTAN